MYNGIICFFIVYKGTKSFDLFLEYHWIRDGNTKKQSAVPHLSLNPKWKWFSHQLLTLFLMTRENDFANLFINVIALLFWGIWHVSIFWNRDNQAFGPYIWINTLVKYAIINFTQLKQTKCFASIKKPPRIHSINTQTFATFHWIDGLRYFIYGVSWSKA